jgi:hypothetical protein
MENFLELMRQARVYMFQHPEFIPLHHVEEVAMYGNVDAYVVGQGVDVNTPDGNAILVYEAALYLVCRQLCDLGVGDRPFHPLPYLHDPIIVEEEEVVVGDPIVPMEQPLEDPLGDDVPVQAAAAQPPVVADDGVQIQGPFVWPDPLPPPPPLVRAPEPKPEPKLEPKQEPNQGSEEYVEPYDEELDSYLGAN